MKLYAATGQGVTRLEPNGENTWRATATLTADLLKCVALDPRDPATLYAGSESHGLWKTTDGAQTWHAMPVPHSNVFSVAVSPADGAVYVGCEPSALFRSPDGGNTWNELEALKRIPSQPTWSFPPRPWTSHVRWIAPNPHDASVILVGIELGGVMRSADSGQTWDDHRPGAQLDCHALAWHPTAPGRVYEAAGGGAAWSNDGGRSWQPADAGRDRHYTWALAVDPGDPDCWYVSASPGPRQAHYTGRAQAVVYRWRGPGPWQALYGGPPQPLDSMVYALVAVPGQLFAGLRDGRIYESRDGGDTWQALTVEGDAPRRIDALVCAMDG